MSLRLCAPPKKKKTCEVEPIHNVFSRLGALPCFYNSRNCKNWSWFLIPLYFREIVKTGVQWGNVFFVLFLFKVVSVHRLLCLNGLLCSAGWWLSAVKRYKSISSSLLCVVRGISARQGGPEKQGIQWLYIWCTVTWPVSFVTSEDSDFSCKRLNL